ncbi:hypothetical protein R3W88_019411 [Solanum pinnatisectum]|uniref:Myosin motor domain-containing protein n=1 Tax=Solanum pinnatisectum TaxID=50273 RepID=A0AAV9KJN0_9SOLN|nr:hypothetical protein R3W88_019411 [Solanum pinnatisectum]
MVAHTHLQSSVFQKLRVWCHLKNRQWEPGQVQSTSRDEASILLSDGSVMAVPVGELLPANPDILQGVDDLTQLCYLNKPSVLHNLQYRYAQDRIYAGPVLIAVNPFKEIQMYGSKLVTTYKKKLLDSPHIYSIAETAYSQMMKDEINQSIIISELLQTSCILEDFGIAKTLRNNNSSQFGRLIEIYFSAKGGICCANVQAFLLEKSKVVLLAHGERSYHSFYQLCAGAHYKLKLKGASEYNFLNQSNSLVIHNVDDAKKFHMLVKALNIAGIFERDQEHSFQMVDAVLWLGNLTFQAIGNGNYVEVISCSLCYFPTSLIPKVVKSLTMQQIVDKINRSLAMGESKTGRSINILDIYVDFQDNQECLDLFEKSNFDKATDLPFANKLKQHLKANPCYRGDREEFGIRHYAGEVIYDTSGFLNKNRDTVHPDTNQLLSSSSEDLLKLFASSFANQSKKTASSIRIEISDFQKQTFATKFKDVLFKLMQQLESTAPHFICCIKPNVMLRGSRGSMV